MAKTLDERDLLVISSAGKIIFKTGKGRLAKSMKIIASLTQALTLFGNKVLNEQIKFVRFQNQRMVFINEGELFCVKLVPKDHLSNQFAPSMRVITKFISNFQNNDELVSQYEWLISSIYHIFRKPEKCLFVINGDLDGYSALTVLMAALVYDLPSHNLDSIVENIRIVNVNDNYSFSYPSTPVETILAIGLTKSDIQSSDNIPIVSLTTKISPINALLPDIHNPADLVGFLFGKSSNAEKIQGLIHRADVKEVVQTLIQVPSVDISIETIKEAILDFSQDNRLAKPLYKILIRRLREYETKIGKEEIIGETSSEIQSQEIVPTTTTPPVIETITPTIEEPIIQSKKEIKQKSEDMTIDSLASKFEVLANTQIAKTLVETKIEHSVSEIIDSDLSSLPLNENSYLLESGHVFVDARPFMKGDFSAVPDYAPSLQITTQNDKNIVFNIILTQGRSELYETLLDDIAKATTGIINQIPRGFSLTIPKETYYVALRSLIWSLIIEYNTLVQENIRPRTPLLEIPNEGSICLLQELTETRRAQLPSQIVEIFEEEAFIQEIENDENPVKVAQSIDALLGKIGNHLRYGQGVGFVLRSNSLELPLIMQFVLSLSEICGIGWSRW